MFGFRPDGKKLKVDPLMKCVPHIMNKRYDAQVNFLKEIRCENIDSFIAEQEKRGFHFTYMDIVISAMVRMLAERPYMNRFAINGRIYQRNKIAVAFVVKKSLKENGEETTVKLEFDGTETIYEIKRKIDNIIRKNIGMNKNSTDKAAKILTFMPNFLIKFGWFCIKLFDKWGMLPASVLQVSPFHTSFLITNMKSISTEYVYHHIYDFGTASLFASIGKEEMLPCVNKETNSLEVGKVLKIGLTVDERICDGLYYARGIKLATRYILNPNLLIDRPLNVKPLKTKKEIKLERKMLKTKREQKVERKNLKKLFRLERKKLKKQIKAERKKSA